jgi:hypothetical protein
MLWSNRIDRDKYVAIQPVFIAVSRKKREAKTYRERPGLRGAD